MNILIFIFFLLLSLRTILAYVHLWYVKEYRWDRMYIHLHTPQAWNLLFPSWKYPPVSPKTIVLVIVLTLYATIVYWMAPLGVVGNFILSYISIFIFSWIAVFCMFIPTYIYHEYVIYTAVQKLRKHKKMIVIGITGSFGKTSTKEFLSTILGEKYTVLKTQASKNSPIGIAETILKDLTDEHEVFVVEMGAYRPGEIARMCSMVHPEIGIVIAINPQHQDLFRSIETTVQAKYELFKGLTGKKIAIGNIDNTYVSRMLDMASDDSCSIWGVGKNRKSQKMNLNEYFCYSLIHSMQDSLDWKLSHASEVMDVNTKIRGEHFALNASLAIVASYAAGFSLSESIHAALKLINYDKSMEILPGPHKSILINDTFNNNPDAAIASISYAKIYKGDFYLVFQPMIELGSYAFESHERVGEFASRYCKKIFLTNHNFNEGFNSGIQKNPKNNVSVICSNAKDITRDLYSLLKPGDTVLFKGKEAAFILHELQILTHKKTLHAS